MSHLKKDIAIGTLGALAASGAFLFMGAMDVDPSGPTVSVAAHWVVVTTEVLAGLAVMVAGLFAVVVSTVDRQVKWRKA